ncbi:hypothetical protein LTS18_009271 [Coniosporium uncinatum]|uniref:Uncharacterized protein n=1 Tax=Coniosporium uncinatum TaxID=93489 RepID=A0ACC3DDD1_9PEZI|nr:hypothetical protein LTS18_009271 [Coniosporium uncinatum]
MAVPSSHSSFQIAFRTKKRAYAEPEDNDSELEAATSTRRSQSTTPAEPAAKRTDQTDTSTALRVRYYADQKELEAVQSELPILPLDMHLTDRHTYETQLNQYTDDASLVHMPLHLVRIMHYFNLNKDRSFSRGFLQTRWTIEQLQFIQSAGYELDEIDYKYGLACMEAHDTPNIFSRRDEYCRVFAARDRPPRLVTTEEIEALRKELHETDGDIEKRLAKDWKDNEDELFEDQVTDMAATISTLQMEARQDEDMQDVDSHSNSLENDHESIASDDEDLIQLADLRAYREGLVRLLGVHVNPSPTDQSLLKPTSTTAPPRIQEVESSDRAAEDDENAMDLDGPTPTLQQVIEEIKQAPKFKRARKPRFLRKDDGAPRSDHFIGDGSCDTIHPRLQAANAAIQQKAEEERKDDVGGLTNLFKITSLRMSAKNRSRMGRVVWGRASGLYGEGCPDVPSFAKID